MRTLIFRVTLGVAAGVAVYVGFSIWADAGKVSEALGQFRWSAALLALGIVLVNYAVRFARWAFYLRVLDIRLAIADSLLVFLSGFALTVTPGKLGEAVKAFLLKQSHQIPVTRTAPIVIAERVTDLVALLLLALVGVFSFDVDRRFLGAGALLVGLGIVVVSVDSVSELALAGLARIPGLRRIAPRLADFRHSTAALLRPTPLLAASALSVVSWFLECVAFWVIVGGFPGTSLTLRAATFIYASMTVAGALSFLPGGLGVTEAGMLTLLGRLGTGIGRGPAAAATFLTRACTLWFAVALGLPALILYGRRKHVAVDATRLSPAEIRSKGS